MRGEWTTWMFRRRMLVADVPQQYTSGSMSMRLQVQISDRQVWIKLEGAIRCTWAKTEVSSHLTASSFVFIANAEN